MITIETMEALVGAIFNDKDMLGDEGEELANAAALYFNTAMICQAKGIDKAMKYFKTEKRTDLYEPYLWGDPTQE